MTHRAIIIRTLVQKPFASILAFAQEPFASIRPNSRKFALKKNPPLPEDSQLVLEVIFKMSSDYFNKDCSCGNEYREMIIENFNILPLFLTYTQNPLFSYPCGLFAKKSSGNFLVVLPVI
jgi:hypothetical protein